MRPIPVVIVFVGLGFNPRICKRCDYIKTTFDDLFIGFNPRICKRCDKANALATRAIMVSIHASVKDATPCL